MTYIRYIVESYLFLHKHNLSFIYIYMYVCVFYFKKVKEQTISCRAYSLKIINPQNIDKNILENSGKNRINIEITHLYFSTNQLKTQNKNILENPAQKLSNKKIFRLQNEYTNLISQEMSARLNFRTRNKTNQNPIFGPL